LTADDSQWTISLRYCWYRCYDDVY